ncbi:N-acetylmuramoyl-L-alanine amidase family protein [Bacillus mycoides]|uniref:peptidoglycan recognition protein family protein n=1 Tax=Bacillus mycoides TaxID=1405 RepID=UPI001C02C798|nr:N-acetylmuramoyl-L-alanine amidase family protein [Bacillus mycoides]QWG56882.1 N-acetylmuramoyl-L-alanine amidase family protein [Bacillus mycoides]QWG75339.1 N-acetylmuramoyl-L-alanine amidase family protein [Bacillus mycoides]QWH23891.1 N-acetylmuramoyl-L-alanine amidase family protein [Bacillus mycoides]
MEIRKKLVDSSKHGIKCPYAMTPEFITVHNTYNDASAENEISYMIGNNNSVSFHVAVDDKEAVQGIPFDRNAWHAGDGNGNGNRKSIGIEICYSLSGGDKYYKAEDNAAIVIAQLMKQFNIPISNVRTHKSWSGKNCPHRMLDEGRLDKFIEKVNNAINNDNNSNNNKPPQPEGIGFAQSKYPEGFGVNYYDRPHGDFQGRFTTAAEVLYWVAYWGADGDVWLDLGGSRWVKAEHYNYRPFKAISKFPEGYKVGYFDGINGTYKGSITSKEPLTVFVRKQGWIDIGGNNWTPEEHFDIVDIR